MTLNVDKTFVGKDEYDHILYKSIWLSFYLRHNTKKYTKFRKEGITSQ